MIDRFTLRKKRQELELTQREVVVALGLSPTSEAAVSDWEIGKVPIPEKHQEKLSEILNIKVDNLIREGRKEKLPMSKDRETQSRKFWTEFCGHLKQRGSQLYPLEPMVSDYKHYRDFQIGIPGFAVRASQRIKEGLGAAFIMRGDNASPYFSTLLEQQAEIHKECGESLSWYPTSSEKRVAFIKQNIDVTDATDWPNQHAWLVSKLEKLNEVFPPRIMALNTTDWTPVEDKGEAYNEEESFMEEQADYVTSPSESNMPMHAYVVMLHLISQGYSDFTEIRKVLCRESVGTYYITILDYIFKKLQGLEEAWGEIIPPITALVFNTDGRAPKWTCKVLTGNGETQPTAKQIAELAASVAAYDKWDKVLKALKTLID